MTARTFGRFLVEWEAGRGGMGVVYRGVDAHTGAAVALKVLPHAAANAESIARFEREAAALAAVDHPAIVRYVAHGRADTGELFLAMDWLDGEDLAARLFRSALALDDAVDLARTLAEALGVVHARGLVHRDLKPSNVLLVGGDVRRPVLLDFGIARSAADMTMTKTGAVIGTPQYMAPEQVRGSRAVDGRADLFALGLVLHECITGRPAFAGEHPMAVLAKILLEETPPLAASGRLVPAPLEALLADLLAKDPDRRPGLATEVVAALDRIAIDLPRSAGAPTLTANVERPPAPAALTGRERRIVAVVLAADKRVSSALAETATPESASRDRRAIEDAVRPHGGELSPLGPARFLVSFPGGGEATDQAGRAARCALSVATAWPGATVALAVGSAQLHRAPVGEVIDRAAAILDAPGDARVRADDATAALLEVRFAIQVRHGMCEIVAERRAEERPRTLLGKPTRFVGRDRELSQLAFSLDEVAEDGVARAILVTGVSGAGKSRLRHEFVDRARARDAPVAIFTARAEPLRSGSPLDLCAGLVRAWAAIGGADAAVSRAALTAKVARRVPEAERADVAELLGEIVGAPFPDDASPRLAAARRDARLLGEHMLRAFLALLRAECAAHPVVLVLEDLHWGDPQTVRFLDAALRELAAMPLLVLALARPEVGERFPGLWRSRGVSELSLGALSPRACERLAADVLGDAPPELLARIVKHADGNALYLEELIRAASEGGLASLPVSVIAMVQARLESLDAAARRVLRAASVIGESFERDALGALLADAPAEVDAALDRLTEAEVMSRRGDAFAFRHAAVREAAYAMLTDPDRRLGHGLVARWLEAAGERDAQLLAEHHDRAGDAANAARCFARAAWQAVQRSDFDAALTRGARAIDLGASGAALGEAHLARGRACHCLGRLVDSTVEVEAALAALPDDADALRVEALRELWNVSVYRQLSPAIRRAGEEALRLAYTLERKELVAEAQCALAIADYCEERCAEALDRYRDAVGAAGERPSVTFAVSGIMLYHAGAYEEAERSNVRMIAIARDLRDFSTLLRVLPNQGATLAGLARYEEAREHFAEARVVGDAHGLPMLTARAMSISSGQLFDVLDVEAGVTRAAEAREIGRAMEFVTPRISSSLDLAFAAVRRGELDRAREVADEIAAQVASGTGFHGWLWRSRMLVLRAEIAERGGAFTEAIGLADGAIASSVRQRRLKYVAAGEIVRARALAGLGRHDEAAERLGAFLAEALAFPDPAVHLRVATTLLALSGDGGARDVASRAAARMESGLPAGDKPRFRRAVDPLLAA